MSCILRINGKDFDVQGFLEITELKPYEQHLKGEKRPFKRTGKQLTYDESGCRFQLSDADFKEFKQQRKDAIHFLTTNFDKLKAIFSFGLSDNENPRIDFGIETRMYDVEVQCDHLEPELLRLAGNLNFGIEISQYQLANEDGESE